MENQPRSWKFAALIVVIMVIYVGWVAFYVMNLRPLVLMWCYKNLGMTGFPILGHVILIFSPLIVVGLVMNFIRSIKGTIVGRSYSE